MRQWRQLCELLVTDGAQHPRKRKASRLAPEGLKDKAARRLPKDRSVAIEGVFRPNERIRSLPAVFQAPDQVVLLKCSECGESMNSTWFWKHPGDGGIYALVPHHGHTTCHEEPTCLDNPCLCLLSVLKKINN